MVKPRDGQVEYSVVIDRQLLTDFRVEAMKDQLTGAEVIRTLMRAYIATRRHQNQQTGR